MYYTSNFLFVMKQRYFASRKYFCTDFITLFQLSDKNSKIYILYNK